MVDLVEKLDLGDLLSDAGLQYSPGDNFEHVYQALSLNSAHSTIAKTLEDRIRNYFLQIQIPPTATLYDRLLLSLRPKDLIATFNWDPLLVQAFKRNRGVCVLPRILFLHGNVDCGACERHLTKGFLEHSCDTCGRPMSPVPLLYPIAQKNYDRDPFIRNEWDELRDVLTEAYLLTIVGYAAPESDVEAKDLMLSAWADNGARELAEIEIVDIKPEREVEQTWKPFIVRQHYSIWEELQWLFAHPRRTCDHFAMASLQQHPCHETPLTTTDNLAELQAFIAPLLAEEAGQEAHGTPFPC